MNNPIKTENVNLWNWELEKACWKKEIRYIAGVDEAGRGALCGPVVACAVIFSKPFEGWEVIKDSKKLRPKQRLKGYLKIIKNALSLSIGLANPDEIDNINIRNATHKAMMRAIEKLSLVPDIVFIDGNASPSYDARIRCIVKGDDKVVSIAAASIIAKVYRDYIMNEYSKKFPEYGFEKHKGYGTPEHIMNIIRYGLTPWHRKTFKDLISLEYNLFS